MASLGGSSTGTVVLSANVRDITSVTGDPSWEANAGDIRNATVSFLDRGTGAILGTVAVGANGVATLNWTVDLGASTTKTYTIGFLVSNYYNRNSTTDNATVVVNK